MTRYLIRRVLFMVLVLFAISLITFLIFIKLPTTDPAIRAAGRHPTPALLAVIRHRFGLDRPIWVQYWKFASGMIPWPGLFLNENVYFSYITNIPVRTSIAEALPVTAMLTLGSAALWIVIGIPIGVVSAVRPGTWIDRSAMLAALIGVSAPDFWLGLVFIYLFHFTWHIAPSPGIPVGMSVITAALTGRFVMPWVVLASTTAAFYSRMTRSGLIETIGEDYIRTARAKGLPERTVIYRHGLRSAITPVVSMFGLDVGFLLGGAVIVETVFELRGLGAYAIQSISVSDFPAIMGVTVLGALFIVIANLVIDVVYAFLDPRVRYT